jgi:uncharacterized membrane protein
MNKRESLVLYLGLFLIIAVVGAFSGCAGTQVQNKETLLSAAGFRARTPSTQEQWAMYNRMTPYKLERNTFKGKALYTYADKQKGVVYIGGDKAYQRYKQLRIQQSIAQSELEATYSNYLAEMDRVWSVNYD